MPAGIVSVTTTFDAVCGPAFVTVIVYVMGVLGRAVVGPVFVHVARELKPERESISEDEVGAELVRVEGAIEAVAQKLSATGERLRDSGNEEEAAIFDAHVELAQDPELFSGVEERIRNLTSSEAAVLSVGEEYAQMFAAMEDEYLAAVPRSLRSWGFRRSSWPAAWLHRTRLAYQRVWPWVSSPPKARRPPTSRSWPARWGYRLWWA